MALVAALTTVGPPIGSVRWWPSEGSIPNGWVSIDGSTVSRTTYAGLFAEVNTTHGAGDGSTTFGLPDARGRVLVAAGNGGTGSTFTYGTAGGASTVALTDTHLPIHNHGGSLQNANLSHTHNGVTNMDGTHNHGLAVNYGPSGIWSGDWIFVASKSNAGIRPTYEQEAHTHSAYSTSTNIDHRHSIASTGSGQAHNNIASSISLNAIVRAAI